MVQTPVSIRLPDQLIDHLDRAGINRSAVARDALKDELLANAVGVCAVTGKICYQGDFATVSSGSPIGQALDLPSSVSDVDVIDSVFSDLAKDVASGRNPELPDEIYLHHVGPATYLAERLLFKHLSALDETGSSWVLERIVETDTVEDGTEYHWGVRGASSRTDTLLSWLTEQRERDDWATIEIANHPLVDRQTIWAETPTAAQEELIDMAVRAHELTDYLEKGLQAVLGDALDTYRK